MLQSIHQGQILRLQTLQVVALPRFILSVEQFIEKLSWLGTLPSIVRKGEDPSAQVPQQVQDASSEATIPRAFYLSSAGVEMRPDEAVFPEPIVPAIHGTMEAGESQLRQEVPTPERTSQTPEDPPSPGVELSFA